MRYEVKIGKNTKGKTYFVWYPNNDMKKGETQIPIYNFRAYFGVYVDEAYFDFIKNEEEFTFIVDSINRSINCINMPENNIIWIGRDRNGYLFSKNNKLAWRPVSEMFYSGYSFSDFKSQFGFELDVDALKMFSYLPIGEQKCYIVNRAEKRLQEYYEYGNKEVGEIIENTIDEFFI